MKDREENSQRQAHISWENIVTSLEDGVIVVDREGMVSFFNQSAEALTDVSASQALNQHFCRLFGKNPWLITMIHKSHPPQQISTRGEGAFVTASGRRVPVNLSVSPLHDRRGRSLGSLLLVRDLTHRKELEEDLRRSDRLAALGTLAAGLAHEIKNPLGGIKGAGQLLRRSVMRDSSLLQYTDIIIREVERVNELIEQLLDLSRPARLNLVPLNVHELLNDVLLLEKQALEERNITLKKSFDPSLPAIQGDRSQLVQVFLNLVKNALEAMGNQGCLKITSRLETDFHIREPGRKKAKFISVDIEDNGSGIKEANLPHIFSPFFTTKNNGTGLGLAISYRIIREHGGLIRVESQEGKGTIFRVLLLVAEPTRDDSSVEG
ncbi:MAG: PAS domain S-box protein [Deltaproteobacteria bacterium]|nr:PAS domain S-box protein [Deltaproteobacteria bacterium]